MRPASHRAAVARILSNAAFSRAWAVFRTYREEIIRPAGHHEFMVVIDAWFSQYPFPSFLETVRKRAAEFECAFPGYRVEVRAVWWQRLPQEVSLAAARGRPPALASYYSGATRHALDTRAPDGRPLFTSVGRAIGGRTEILGQPVVVDDLVDAARAFYTLGGSLAA